MQKSILGLAALCLTAVFVFVPVASGHRAPFSHVNLLLRADGIDATVTAHIIDLAHDLSLSPGELNRASALDEARKSFTEFLTDANNGGSGIEYPTTLNKAAAGIKGDDSIILGHTPTTLDWSAFLEYGELNQSFLDAVRAAHKEGKSPDEAFSSIRLPEKFKDYGMGRAKANVTAIYSELKGQ
jgi:hypothetical protein